MPVKKAAPTSLPGDRKQPETTKRIQPTYPKSALNNGGGTVKVKVTGDSSGKPINVKIISSSGHSVWIKPLFEPLQMVINLNQNELWGKMLVEPQFVKPSLNWKDNNETVFIYFNMHSHLCMSQTLNIVENEFIKIITGRRFDHLDFQSKQRVIPVLKKTMICH